MVKQKRKQKLQNKNLLRPFAFFLGFGFIVCSLYSLIVVLFFTMPINQSGEAARDNIDRFFAVPETATNLHSRRSGGISVNYNMRFDIPANQHVLDHWLEEELDGCIHPLNHLTYDDLQSAKYNWVKIRNPNSVIGNFCGFPDWDRQSIVVDQSVVDQSDDEQWTVHMHIFMPYR